MERANGCRARRYAQAETSFAAAGAQRRGEVRRPGEGPDRSEEQNPERVTALEGSRPGDAVRSDLLPAMDVEEYEEIGGGDGCPWLSAEPSEGRVKLLRANGYSPPSTNKRIEGIAPRSEGQFREIINKESRRITFGVADQVFSDGALA